MLTKEFNALPFIERRRMVFREGKFIDSFVDNKLQKCFFYKLDDLKIDVIYDTEHNSLVDIIAWDKADERVQFLKMLEKDRYTGRVEG